MRIMIIDTETTGLLPKIFELTKSNLNLLPHIVQFSYIIYDTEKNNIIKMVDHIIKLPENIIISEENSNIHKITNEISQSKGNEINFVLCEFIENFKKTELTIGHNLEFDLNMIKIELLRASNILNDNDDNKIIYFDFLKTFIDLTKLYCTMKNSIHICNIKTKTKTGKEYIKFPKLNELHITLFNSAPRNLHNSLNDVLICLRCYYMLEHKVDIIEIDDVVKSLLIELI